MAKKNILVTQKLPDAVENALKVTFETILTPEDKKLSSDTIIQQSQYVDAILCAPGDQIGADLIATLSPTVKIIATFSVGYEHIDVAAAARRGICVTNTPGVLTDATADIALLLMLGAARRAYEGERLIREETWTGWTPTQLMGVGLQGKRLGILGMGRIGEAVATRAKAFGMEIHYHNRKPVEYDAIYHDTPESLLKVSDVLSLHFPLTPQTRGFINAERLSMLPKGAIVVNTARGPVVADEDLIAALKMGQVGAAGLDVFTGEPDIHPGYRHLPNTFLLPHLGSATHETRNAMGFCALENLKAFFEGRDVPNPVTA